MKPQDDHPLHDLIEEVRLTRSGFLGAGVGAGALAGSGRAEAATGPTREYWVGAVPVTWNLVPNGRNAIEGPRFSAEETTMRTVLYREFSRGWRRQLAPRDKQTHGFLGPLIRAEVGDRILVHFKNMDTEFGRPHSMHFHGVHYDIESDGSYVPLHSGRGGNVRPGESFTYRLTAGRDSVGAWPYHDHSPSMMDSIHGGMYGALSISDPRKRRPRREFTVFFGEHKGFMTINGRAFVGNTPVFRAKVGDLVQWNVLALGDQFHTFHIHGHRWRQADGTAIDTRTIGPAESFSFRFRENAPGTWLYHCHVESHMTMGMIGLYRVTS
jgi:FtsP/CotA-like multicopper oxidase with cupredoxin domain